MIQRVLLSVLLGIGVLVPLGASTPATAAVGPNPYASAAVTKTYDGTGHGTAAQSFVNTANGFTPGDDTGSDGVVSSKDTVGYDVTFRIFAGPARTVAVKLAPDSMLEWKTDRASFCADLPGINGALDGPNNQCLFTVTQGATAQITRSVVLTAKDSAGLAVVNQKLSVEVGQASFEPYATVSSQPVTVVSAPSADVRFVQPAQLNYATATGGTVALVVDELRRVGFSPTKGVSTLTSWSGEVDVSEFPTGTTWKVGGVSKPVNDGKIAFGPVTGNQVLQFTFPGGTPPAIAKGDVITWDLHVIVPDTAFATPDYPNNGTGWQPGDGKPRSFSTYDESLGSRAGQPYPNNDWTRVALYRSLDIPGVIFSKRLARPYTSGQSLFEAGNMLWGASSGEAWSSINNPQKVAPTTRVRDELLINTPLITGNPAQIAVADVWDAAQQVPDGKIWVTDPAGNLVSPSLYSVYWSTTATKVNTNVADPSDMTGWIPLSQAPANASGVKVIFAPSALPLGSHADAGVFRVQIPLRTLDLPNSANPLLVDRGYGYVTGGTGGFYQDNAVLMVWPVPTTLGLTHTVTPAADYAGTLLNFTLKPTVSDPTKVSDGFEASVTVTLDKCVMDPVNTSTKWAMTFVPGTPGPSGRVCGDPASTPGKLIFLPNSGGTINHSSYDVNNRLATLPNITYQVRSRLSAQYAVANTGLFSLTAMGQVAPVSADAVSNILAASASSAVVRSNPKQVEVTDSLRWTVDLVATMGALQSSATVIALPRNGDGSAYFAGVDNPGSYPDAHTSDFNGQVKLASAALDDEESTSNATLLYTTTADPSLDPDSNAETWHPVAGATQAQLEHATALKVIFGNSSGASNARVKVTMTPTGNKSDDVYLLWAGETVFTGSGSSTGAPQPWPAQVEVIAGTISGRVWLDQDNDAVRDSGENLIEGATIGLFELHGDGTPAPVANQTTVTGPDGSYEFAQLHSGAYVTRVLDRGPNLPASATSYYGQEIALQQTYSFKDQTFSRSQATSSRITLMPGGRQLDVDYGYFQAAPKVDVDKKNVSAACANGVCALEWNVDLKNLGNSDIIAGTLTDTVSKSVYDVEVLFGEYSPIKVKQVATTADNGYALMSDGTVYAWGTGSNGGNGNGGLTNLYAKPVLTAPNTPLTGVKTVIARQAASTGIYGAYALMEDGRVFSWGYGYGGMNGNGSTANNIYAQPVLTAANTELTGVTEVVSRGTGAFVVRTDGSAYSWGDGSSFANANGGSATNLYAQPILTAANTPLVGVKSLSSRYNQGGLALLQDGRVYSWGPGGYGAHQGANGNGSSADNVYAQPVLTAASTPLTGVRQVAGKSLGGTALLQDGSVMSWGSGVQGWNGNGGTNYNLYAQPVLTAANTPLTGGKALPTSGSPTSVLRQDGSVYAWGPGNKGANGNGGDGAGGYLDNLYAQPVMTTASTPLTGVTGFASDNRNSGEVVTRQDGSVYAWGSGDLYANSNGWIYENLYAEPVLTAVNTPLTNVTQVAQRFNGGLALRQDGTIYAWGRGNSAANGNGGITDNEYAQPVLSDPGKVLGEATASFSLSTGVAASSVSTQGNFTERTYRVGLLPAGETLGVVIRGKVNQGVPAPRVLNQAWFSSATTPITGLLTGGKIKPDLPVDPGAGLDPLGIAGNPTCNTDADAGGQSVADSCDQVPVALPMPSQYPGMISGMVWADGDHNGTKAVAEPMIGGVPVSLFKGNTLLGETTTDVNGVYLFSNIPAGSGYRVSFGITGLPVSNTVLTSLSLDPAKAWSYGYTTRAGACAANVSCAEPATQQSYDVNVTANGHTQNVNAGVVLANAGLSVVKTSTAGEPATLKVNPNGKTNTVPVTVTWVNEGNEPLKNLTWDDETITGPDVNGISCLVEGNPVDGSTILPPGGQVDCTGTLPALDVDQTHEDRFTARGVGTISGTPVVASDTWQAAASGAASWTMNKTSNPASGTQVQPGSQITYTLQVTNTGDLNLTDLLVTDDLSQVLNQAALVGVLPDGVQRSGTTLFWNVPVLGPGQSLSISYTVKIDDHAWKKTVLNKAFGTGSIPPAQCTVERPCQTTHSTPEQPKVVDPPADPPGHNPPGDTPPPPTTKKPVPHKLPDTGAPVTPGMLLLGLGLVGAGAAALTKRRRRS